MSSFIRFSAIAALAFVALLSASVARADDVTVDAWVGGIFIPTGFDDNDEVVVALDGFLPNSCYQLLSPTVVREDNNFKIDLKVRVNQGPCLVPSSIPYSKLITIGQLPAGDYTFEANAGLTFENLHVEQAPATTQDTYTYALVDAAGVDRNQGALTAVLYVKLLDTCSAIQEVKVIDSVKTVELLPIVTRTASEGCQPDESTRVLRVAIPASVSAGRHLLHVRSMGGQSVNLMFSKP